MSNNKNTRRKAIDCKLIRQSQSDPSFYKYMITIEDTDGTITKNPAYGKDMQDAIKRLVRAENAEMVVKVVERKQHFFMLALFAFCIVLPIIGGYNSTENKNLWMILPLLIIVFLFFIVGLFEKYRS
tara:strand:- start:838 stop:1218 length:381 start_codon:yes stop_codon:yes gene_type:complete